MTTSSASAETSILKAVAVLNCFRGDDRRISLTELARKTALPKSTVHRLCSSLVAAGYLARDDQRTYRLGVSVFELGSAAVPVLSIRTDASRFLQQLSLLSGETSHLGVLDDGDVLYIDKIETMQSPSIPSRVGQRNPAHATGLGKAMLAWDRAAAASILSRAPHASCTPHTITSGEE
ncbi:MAG TPA: IclR family transcriptional regulator, partial [Acidimicrobiales bacterium]|nr:IclR family transcriptional regulator [Acidimicrobiales bacterium]